VRLSVSPFVSKMEFYTMSAVPDGSDMISFSPEQPPAFQTAIVIDQSRATVIQRTKTQFGGAAF